MNFKPSEKFLGHITSKEAGIRYGVTNDYIARLCRQGKIECLLVGRAWHVKEESLAKRMGKRIVEKDIQAKDLSRLRRSEYRAQTIKGSSSSALFQKVLTGLFAGIFVFGGYTALTTDSMEVFSEPLLASQAAVVKSLDVFESGILGLLKKEDASVSNGVPLYDVFTGELYCIKVFTGSLALVSGECSDFKASDLVGD